jgi:hypothetical protein
MLIISFGINQNASSDTITTSKLKNQVSSNEEFMKELGSPLLFKQGPFSPHTGDDNLDNILREFHQMYVSQNAGDFSNAKMHQEKAKTLLQDWEKDQDAKLNLAKRGVNGGNP